MASVPCFIFPIFSYSHDLSSAFASVLLLSLPWRLSLWTPYFCCHAFSSCMLPSCTLLTICFPSSLLTSFNIGSSFCPFDLSFVSASTHFSTLSYPFPPPYLFKCNFLTFDLGYSAPFVVIIFRVRISILLISCIVQSMILALYRMTSIEWLLLRVDFVNHIFWA